MGTGVPPAAARQHQAVLGWPRQQTGTGLRDATDRNLDQDHRQNEDQGPLQKPATDKGSETLVIPQL